MYIFTQLSLICLLISILSIILACIFAWYILLRAKSEGNYIDSRNLFRTNKYYKFFRIAIDIPSILMVIFGFISLLHMIWS